MIELGGINWADLKFSDVENILESGRDEDFFLDYKSDMVGTDKIAKEVCAFANTFGGYIIIGISDDKKIEGCTTWTEKRIHTSIHDIVFPVPVFDVKTLYQNDIALIIIRVEEGAMPPYVTSKGIVFERVSSGSFPIKDAGKLQHLINKRSEGIIHINDKISIPEIKNIPENYCGLVDLGFSLETHSDFVFSKTFYSMDMNAVVNELKEKGQPYSISRLADSYVFTLGKVQNPSTPNKTIVTPSGITYFMEVFRDGSVRMRIPLMSYPQEYGEIRMIEPMYMRSCFQTIYEKLINCDLSKVFISAQKYEKLTVFRQFTPVFDPSLYSRDETSDPISKRNREHRIKYGENIIPIGHRIPVTGFTSIDRRELEKQNLEYSNQGILNALFTVEFFNFGFIDDI